MLPCFGTAIIIYVGDSFANKLLSCRLLAAIGAASYSLYLWHWPLLAFIRYYREEYALTPSVLLCFIVATSLLSYLSYWYVEKPFRKTLSFRTQAWSFGIFASLTAIFFSFSPAVNQAISPQLPVELTRYADLATICHSQMVGDCLRGNITSRHQILIIGDSQAAQLNLAADVIGNMNDVRFKLVSASSCVTIDGFDFDRINEGAQPSCVQQIKEAESMIDSNSIVVVAGLWSYHYKSEPFMRALRNFLDRMDSHGKIVIVLAQIPEMRSNIQRTQRFQRLGLMTYASQSIEWRAANAEIGALTENHPNCIFLNISDNPLFKSAPFHENQLIYLDKFHLNEVGARLYGLALASYFQELLPVIARTPPREFTDQFGK